MRKYVFAAALLVCAHTLAASQNNSKPTAPRTQPTPAARPQQPTPRAQQPRPVSFDLTDYGVRIAPEPRLIVMMAALDAAGWEPTPKGQEPSAFRRTLRQDQESLDPVLRRRLQDFYERNKLTGDATPAQQAARYVSLAYVLGPAPAFDAPPRSEDLPAGVLDVLDFAPLLREFYRQSGMEERLPRYVRMHHEEGNRLRAPTVEMVKAVLTYLHTRPQTIITETFRAADPTKQDSKKKSEPKRPITLTREKDRRFVIVPDLLAAPGAINFRVIGDDYYTIAPFDTNPASSEVRRAYIQFVVDPLVLRYGRAISEKRPAIKQLLDDQRTRVPDTTPDVFLALARSFVVAADVRIEESQRVAALQARTARLLREAKDDASRAAVGASAREEQRRVEDESAARLSEAYGRGAVLSFYFAEQLRGLESSGFDVSNFLGDMIASIDPARESKRLDEAAEAVKRHAEWRARARREAEAAAEAGEAAVTERQAALVKGLREVDELLRLGNYAEAETRLQPLRKEYPQEPRVYFALAQTASRSAQDAFDPALQAQRLNLALDFYRQTVLAASPDTDGAIISRAHAAAGRILTFLERTAEAVKEFDAAIQIGDVKGGAYREALAERQKLAPQP